MPRKSPDAERLLVLTLILEEAIQAKDWRQVQELLSARRSFMDETTTIPEETLLMIRVVEERILSTLRNGLIGVRGDLRNLSAALKIAAPYSRSQRTSSLSLAS